MFLLLFIVEKRIVSNFSYYIDPVNGDDSNTGNSPSSSWKTTTRSDSVSLAPDETIGYKYNRFWYLYRTPHMTANEGRLMANIEG